MSRKLGTTVIKDNANIFTLNAELISQRGLTILLFIVKIKTNRVCKHEKCERSQNVSDVRVTRT